MIFSKLPRAAQRAAFARMSAADKAKTTATPAKPSGARSLGTGGRHQQLTANRNAIDADTRTSQEHLSAGYVRTGRATDTDVDVLMARYRLMHGRDPSPRQITRIRRAR